MKKLIVAMAAGMSLAAFAAGPKMKAVFTVPHELDMLLKYGHIQGATCSEKALYLSHQGGIVKLDWQTGKLIKAVEAPMHLGDIAYGKGRIYGAFGVRQYATNETPCQVAMWDEDLKLLKKTSFRYLRANGKSLARGFDGAVVVGDTFYTGLDHTGEAVWDCPPHTDCPIMAYTLDLEPKGVMSVDLGYTILYGVQTLATDGRNLMLGNYGGQRDKGNPKGYNFSVVTTDGKVVRNGGFGCSEGFGLVPKSVSKRETPVYFTVQALGGNMQGWRKDPEKNPPRIRIDFYEYANGSFADITDRTETK